jgi:hypothetical protein
VHDPSEDTASLGGYKCGCDPNKGVTVQSMMCMAQPHVWTSMNAAATLPSRTAVSTLHARIRTGPSIASV